MLIYSVKTKNCTETNTLAMTSNEMLQNIMYSYIKT